jgi:predicted Ser/Thr protein kinase
MKASQMPDITKTVSSLFDFRLLRAQTILAFFLMHSEMCFFLPLLVNNYNQTTATLSEARFYLAATSSGELVFFGGGQNGTLTVSDRVDIYNVTSGSWTAASFSIPRGYLTAAASGNLVFFAGGWDNNASYYNQVDIYNVICGSWTTATLSQNRTFLAATSVGSLVLFGGGCNNSTGASNIVDIYNVTSNIWTNATLSQARSALAAASVANRYAIFAGGWTGTVASNVVDIFDSLSGVWNTTTLSQARTDLAATSLNNLAFFGGGDNGICHPFQTFDVVDIFNSTTQTWSTATLSQSRTYLAAASIGDIVAFGGGSPDCSAYSSAVDMYNVTSNIWFTAILNQSRYWLAANASVNKILFGGGWNYEFSNTVDTFEFSIVTTSNQPNFTVFTECAILSSLPPVRLSAPQSNISTIIIGVVVGVIALLVSAAFILFLFLFMQRKKHRKGKIITKNTENNGITFTLTEFMNDHRNVNTNQSQTPLTIRPSTKYSVIPFNEIVVERYFGEGSYGTVYLGTWREAAVALKFFKNKPKNKEFMNEIRLMVELPSHPNVVRLFGVSLEQQQLPVIVMEYCEGGSLDKLLFESNVKLSDDYKNRLVRGIAAGMLHLHKHNIIHRDLAARNILLTASGDPKISDFKMSRVLVRDEGKTKSNLGPVCWMAPESLAHNSYSKKTDVWTFGVVVYEIVAQSEPHKDKDIIDVALKIRS